MAWFAWDSISNELNEVPWQSFDHHPDFVYENGTHIRKVRNRTELWVSCDERNTAITKMLMVPEFRDAWFGK